MTQPRRGWGTGGCSLTRPRGQGCLHGGRGTTAHTRAQLPVSALGSVGEPEGGSASASTSHLPKRGAKVQRGRAVLSLSLALAKGLHCPVWQQRRNTPRYPRGANASQTTANKLSRCSRSEETLAGSSRDQRGAQCQGLMPPSPPPPPPSSPPRGAQPTCTETRKTLAFGRHCVSPIPQWLVALPQPRQSCRQQQPRLRAPGSSRWQRLP